jgi:ribonuclease HIII
MNSSSKKISEIEIENYLKQNKKYLINNPNNPHIKYFFKKNNQTITIFKSGTLLIQNNLENNKILTKDYIGCDEVGVGDYFGGLVTCAVYLKKENELKIKQLGVKDSKELSDSQMLNMFNELTKLVKYHVGVYTPQQYNNVIAIHKNTHIAKALLHDETIKKITSNLNTKVDVIMDAFVDAKNYYKYLNNANIKPYMIDKFETHAENKYLAIACASIIARVYFLKQIDSLSEMVNQQLPLGASNPDIIKIAKNIYKKGGMDLLQKIAKIDFRITKKVVS